MAPETSYSQLVGQVIRGRRELAGISIARMAESASLSSPSGWSRVETGDTTMNLAQLRKAALALNVEPWTIIQQTDLLARQLAQNGVVIRDEKPKTARNVLLGGAALLALAGGAVAVASLSTKPEQPVADDSSKDKNAASSPRTAKDDRKK
jgi:transcriptional regulator with XRE-family HTH domain